MNIFHKVTLRSLRKNKTRTVVTIIGIILSTALICAVSTAVSSFFDYMKRSIVYVDGSWHGSASDADLAALTDIQDSGDVSESASAQQIGYADIGSDNDDKPFLYIIGADDDFADLLSIHLTSGRLPENKNEIILPDHLSSNGGVVYSPGDTVELEIGQRMRDGCILGQSNPYYPYNDDGTPNEEQETFSIREKRTFTVVGTFQRPGFENWFAPGYTAITTPQADDSGEFRYDIYFSLKNPKNIYKFMENHNLGGETNNELLACLGVVKYDSFTNVIYTLAAIIIALIMFGSISLIYNAFSISVSERTKQFGLLSSIGATKKQLRRSVLFEAGTVSLVGIPAGILLGIAGMGTTLALISDKFDSIAGQAADNVKMKLCVSLPAVIIACVVALATVLISAWIPSKRATRISAVEAIRQTNDIKDSKKPLKTPKLVGKLFGLPGILAHKYYKRSKKKYRATVVSLFMSIVLFIPSSAFTGYLMDMAGNTFYSNGYDISYFPEKADLSGFDNDEILDTLRNEESADHVAYSRMYSGIASVDGKFLSDNMKDLYPEYEDDGLPFNVYFVNDDEFMKLLDDVGADKDNYISKPTAIALDNISAFDPKQQKMMSFEALNSDNCTAEFKIRKNIDGYYFDRYVYEDSLIADSPTERMLYRNLEDPEKTMELSPDDVCLNVKMQSGKTLKKSPFFVNRTDSLVFIYPYSVIGVVLPENADSDSTFSYKLIAKNHKDCYDSIKSLIKNQILPAGGLTDYAEMAESDRNLVVIVKVFSYGFIILISLIAAANVFNTISTNISLRRREFAMLKSIGMTGKGFTRMMNYECVLYGAKSLIYGLPVSIAVTYLIYRSVSEGFVIGFHLPWKAIAIAVSSVLIVVFSTMMYSMHKIKKDNPVDALKNENI